MKAEAFDYKRAGMLRRMGPPGGEGTPINVGVRTAWNALVRDGLAEAEGRIFHRTDSGEQVLRQFDRDLPCEAYALLRLVRDDPRTQVGVWALHPLVGAGLVAMRVRSNGIPELTAAGAELLERRGR
jgi:hypothetical protein